MFPDLSNSKSIKYADVKKEDDEGLLIQDKSDSSNVGPSGFKKGPSLSKKFQTFNSRMQVSVRETMGFLNTRDFAINISKRGKEYNLNSPPKKKRGFFQGFISLIYYAFLIEYLNIKYAFFDLKQRIIRTTKKKGKPGEGVDPIMQKIRLKQISEMGGSGASFRSNWSKSFKYTPLTFFPKNLFYQFQRVPNVWFLVTSVLSIIPLFGNSGAVGLYLLIVALSINFLKDLLDDWKRHHLDWIYNNKQFYSLKKQENNSLQWMIEESRNIFVGDIIMVQRDDYLPADVICLATSGKNLASYVKTTNLDGEANMKAKYALKDTQDLYSQLIKPGGYDDEMISRLQNITHLQGESVASSIEQNAVSCDLPNNKVNQFSGQYLFQRWVDGQKDYSYFPLTNDNVILRGCQVKNTEWVIGVVTYAGKDAKIQQNQVRAPRKRNIVESATNYSFLIQMLLVLVACAVVAVFSVFFLTSNSNPRNEFTGAIRIQNIPSAEIPLLTENSLFQGLDFEKQVNYHYYLAFEIIPKIYLGVAGYFLALVQIILLVNQCIPIAVLFNLDLVQIYHARSLTLDPLLNYQLKKPETKVNGDDKQLAESSSATSEELQGKSKKLTRKEKRKLKKQKELEEKIPFICRTTRLSENLGVIKYIFTDKTGTLTENELQFISCMISGQQYGSFDDDEVTQKSNPKKGVSHPDEFHRIVLDENLREDLRIVEGQQANIDILTPDESSEYENYSIVPQSHASQPQGKRPNFKTLESIRSVSYGDASSKVVEYWRAFALCNQIELIENRDSADEYDHVSYKFGKELSPLAYQGQSPDDITAAEAAQQLGLELVYRDNKVAKIQNHLTNKLEVVKILALNKFEAKRRRMSVLCQLPSGNYRLYCKGADSVIMPRLHQQQNQQVIATTNSYIRDASNMGLRALCVTYRDIPTSVATSWLERLKQIQGTNNAGRLEQLQEELESDLELLGASVVEDKLQDGVQDTIRSLQQAGINVWMITGDMLQTAISIGKSCQLLTPGMENNTIIISKDMLTEALKQQGIIQANVDNPADKSKQSDEVLKVVQNILKLYLQRIKQASQDSKFNEWALVIEGDLITTCTSKKVVKDFFEICKICNAVICCRASPQQKAQVVKLVKDRIQQCTLAIGDGENDAVMITQADVGIGLAGKEGNSAVQNSDFSMGRFRFLKHLILVRGRWINYNNQIMEFYYLFKALCQAFVLFWFVLYTGYSGTSIFPQSIASLAEFFTIIGILQFSYKNQDVQKDVLIEYPELYKEKNSETVARYTQRALFWITQGFAQSAIIYFICFEIFQKNTSDGMQINYSQLGVGLFFASMITINCKIVLISDTWLKQNQRAIIMVAIGLALTIGLGQFAQEIYMKYTLNELVLDARFWLGNIILAPAAAILPDFIYTIFKPLLYKNETKLRRVKLMQQNRVGLKEFKKIKKQAV